MLPSGEARPKIFFLILNDKLRLSENMHASDCTFNLLLIREGKDLGEESKGETLEGANDPKTVGDMQSHIAMFYGIRKAFPDINVISEEHGEKTVDLNSVPKLETSNPEVRRIL